VAAVQSNEVYPTPSAMVRLASFGGASDKRFPFMNSLGWPGADSSLCGALHNGRQRESGDRTLTTETAALPPTKWADLLSTERHRQTQDRKASTAPLDCEVQRRCRQAT
jgi:hypothetical protein